MKIYIGKFLVGVVVLVVSGYVFFGTSVCGRTTFDELVDEASFGLETIKNSGKIKAEQSSKFLWKSAVRDLHAEGKFTVEMEENFQELVRRGDENAGYWLQDMEKSTETAIWSA